MSKFLATVALLAFIAHNGPVLAQGKPSCDAICTKRCAQYPAGGKPICMSKCVPGCHQSQKKKSI
jgi:hypothetical protein